MGLQAETLPLLNSTGHTDTVQLCNSYASLTGEHEIIAQSRAFLAQQIDALIAIQLAEGISSRHAAQLFALLPETLAEEALTRGAVAAARLLERAAPALPALESLPPHTAHLSETALQRYKDAGLAYDDLLGDAAAKRWLVRGAAFGKTAWRARHPRKSPALAYWEQCGLQLPLEGLCAEGAMLVANEIRKGEAIFTLALKNKVIGSRAAMDWRLSLIYLLAHSQMPIFIRRFGNWKKPFSDTLADQILALVSSPASSHARLANHVRLSQAPSLETILRMPPEPPKHIDDIFPPSGPQTVPGRAPG